MPVVRRAVAGDPPQPDPVGHQDVAQRAVQRPEKGATVELDQVLMVGEGEDVKVGTPYLKGGKVTATVVDHGRRDKIKVIKFKRRKNYRKQMGHRQYFTQIEITGIDA